MVKRRVRLESWRNSDVYCLGIRITFDDNNVLFRTLFVFLSVYRIKKENLLQIHILRPVAET